MFKKLDVDGSGEISILELGLVLRNLGYPSSVTVLAGLVAEVDVDGSGEVPALCANPKARRAMFCLAHM